MDWLRLPSARMSGLPDMRGSMDERKSCWTRRPVEDVKDSSIGDLLAKVGRRVVDRTSALGRFLDASTRSEPGLSARQYDLDYLVTDTDLSLPLVYKQQPVSHLQQYFFFFFVLGSVLVLLPLGRST